LSLIPNIQGVVNPSKIRIINKINDLKILYIFIIVGMRVALYHGNSKSTSTLKRKLK